MAQESFTLRAGLLGGFNQATRDQLHQKDGTLRYTFHGPFRGLDTTSNPLALDPAYLVEAYDTDILITGAISKRKGYSSVLSSDYGSRTIRQGTEYKASAGASNEVVVYAHTAAASSGVFGKISAGAVSTIASSLSETSRPTFIQFKNLLFFYNGVDDFVYDGTNTRQIGITPPASAPSLASNTNGSLTATATYFVAYTYYNSATGAESSPSPLASVTIAADPNDGITVTYVDGSSATADKVRFYRSVANGAVLYLDTEINLGTTTTTLTQADAGLGDELELDNTRPSVYGSFPYATVVGSRVYLTGDSDIPNRVHVSSIGLNGPKPESFQATQFCDCESSRGRRDANVGLGSANEFTIVLKKESVGRIEQVGANDVSQANDSSIFQYKELSTAVNCLSHHAACSVFGEYVWLGKDNIYATDGTQVRAIADRISNTIKNYDVSDPDKFSGFNDLTNKRVVFTLKSNSSTTEPNIALVGSYINYPEFYWTIYQNYSFGCIFSAPSINSIYAGNVALNGKIYKLNDTNSDNGSVIDWSIRTVPMSYGYDEEEKLYTQDIISCIGDGSDYNMTVKSFYNLSESSEESMSISLNQNVSLWGAFTWGVGLWAQALPVSKKHFSHKKAFYKQLGIENNTDNKPFSIYGFTMIARPSFLR